MKRFLIFSVLALSASLSQSLAQTPTKPEKDVPQAKETSDSRIPSATALGDIFFTSQNSFIFSMGVQGFATDNLYFSPAGSVVGVPAVSNSNGYIPSVGVSGRIAYQRQLQRSTFGLDYGVTGMFFNGSDSDDYLGQHGGIDLSYQPSPRTTFSIGDRISVSPAQGRIYRHDLALGPVFEQVLPNETLLLSLNRAITNAAFTSVSYEVSRRSQITFEANGTITRFQQQNLSEMNEYGGGLEYSFRVAERTSFRLGYHFGYYDFSEPRTTGVSTAYNGVVRNHFAYFGLSHQLTSSVSAFFNVGPNYVVGNSLSASGAVGARPGVRVSINGGLTLTKAISLDPRTFFSIDAGQSVSDGSGLGGITQTQTAGVSLGRRLTKTLTGAIQSSYSRNRFLLNLDANGRPVTTNGISAGANLRVNVTERFNMFANYVYFRQLSNGFADLVPGRDSGNTFTVGLNYSIPVFY